MATDLFQLVIAITLASFLSHLSLLIILGRGDEIYRGVDMFTSSLATDTVHDQCEDFSRDEMYPSKRCIPQAIPAGPCNWGAPLDWQNPAMGSAAQLAPQKGGRVGGHNITNFYM